MKDVIREAVSMVAGVAGAVAFWYALTEVIVKRAMAGHHSDYPFWPLLLLSCFIFLVTYVGLSWLLSKDRRLGAERVLRGLLSFVAGILVIMAFWIATIAILIQLRKPGEPTDSGLGTILFLAFFLFYIAYLGTNKAIASYQLRHRRIQS